MELKMDQAQEKLTTKEKIVMVFLWIVVLSLVTWMGSCSVGAQQTIAPYYTSQGNTNLYIKMGTGNPYQTIAQATTKACTAPTAFTVILLPGANPADTISGQTGVCNGALLIDYTAAPAITYKGNGTIYVSQGGGGGSGVSSFNGRTGAVALTEPDVATAIGGSPSAGQVPTWNGSAYTPQAPTGGLSGQTVNCVPKANSANTSTSSAPICDDGTNTTLSHPVVIAAPGASSDTYTYIGTPIVPLAGSAVAGTDAVGNYVSSDNGAPAGRVCNTVNGQCPISPTNCITSTPSSICITDTTYNGSGYGATTTTLASVSSGSTSTTVGSCSTFITGNGFIIPGAGAAAADFLDQVLFCVGTTLRWTTPTTTTVTSQTVRHTDYFAMNAAVAELGTQPGGGDIFFPSLPGGAPATYIWDGPFQDTGGSNAIIPMPVLANYSATLPRIGLKGLQSISTTGSAALIQTSSCGPGNLIAGYDSATGGGYAPLTNVWLDAQNLSFINTCDNTSLSMIYAYNLQNLTAYNLQIGDTGSTFPTHSTSAALVAPRLSNNTRISIDNIACGDFYTCFQLGEHSNAGSLRATLSVNSLVFDVGTNAGALGSNIGNSATVQNFWTQHSTNGIVAGANKSAIWVGAADFEDLTGNGILDPSNRLFGDAYVNVPEPSGALTYCNANVSGAANLKIHYKWCADGKPTYVAGAGAVNAMTATFTPPIAALVPGLTVHVLPNLANTTTTPTLNVSGLGAKTITKLGAAALAAGDYSTTAIATFIYDGSTNWQLQNPQTSTAISWASPTAGTATSQATFPGGDLFQGGINAQTGTSYTLVAGDENKWVTFHNAAAVAVALPQATTTGFGVGAVFHAVNYGAGTATITPTISTINLASSLVLASGQSADIVSDGSNYTASLGAGATGVSGTLPIIVTGSNISCPTCSTGSGTNVTVNGGGALGTAALNATTPAAPAGNTNVTPQVSGSNVSFYAPSAVTNITAALTWSTGITVTGNQACLTTAEAAVTASAIPGTGTNLVIRTTTRNTAGGVGPTGYLIFNGVTTAIYRSAINIVGAFTQVADVIPSSTIAFFSSPSGGTAGSFSPANIVIPNYTGSNGKYWSSFGYRDDNPVASQSYSFVIGGASTATAAITSVGIDAGSNQFAIGSCFSFYLEP